ncbi:MAG: permease-like cell division protein FtsX [Oscillospiraceae bacterium]|nr:permease-like cell division protein FtsX [Oscillospiraceae bacterium]
MRGSNFSYLVRQGIGSVWHNRMMSFASFCILMVSLLLIGLALLTSYNIGVIIGNIEDTNEILVFIKPDVPDSELSHISDRLRSNYSYVESVVFVSKAEAWEMMKEYYGGDGVEYLFESIGGEDMPSTFVVSLNDITMINTAVSHFRAIEEVESVRASHDFAEFLISIRNTLTIIAIAVLIALIVVCLVIIYNTARTSVFARRMQISIMKHVGATNAFIRFPFFIEGMFIGVIAGAASWFLTMQAYESVVEIFTQDIMILEILGLSNLVAFEDIMWYVLGVNCLLGAMLGALGTVLSMGKHLRV